MENISLSNNIEEIVNILNEKCACILMKYDKKRGGIKKIPTKVSI